MILFIDGSLPNRITLGLITQKQASQKTYNFLNRKNFRMLKEINKFLTQYKAMRKLTRIVACAGPGAFTGIRTSLALAQGLALGLSMNVEFIYKDEIPEDLKNLWLKTYTHKMAPQYLNSYVDKIASPKTTPPRGSIR